MNLLCSKCRQEKEISEFNRNRKSRTGYQYWCRACCKEQEGARYLRYRSGVSTKRCTTCGQVLHFDKFGLTARNTKQRSCLDCELRTRAGRIRAKRVRISIAQAKKRRTDRAATLWTDTRLSDKKKGLANDLTKEKISELITQECLYCGDNSARMSLDRIDNDKGHTIDNVNPCCFRCNHIRGNMPYQAWLAITPSIREARLKGLFGDWVGRKDRR